MPFCRRRRDTMNKGRFGKIIIFVAALLMCALVFSACELSDPERGSKYFINDNEFNKVNNMSSENKDSAIDHVTNGITNLRKYLDSDVVSSTGYYMGMEFNIDTLNPETEEGGNFRLKIQAHLFTFKYQNDDGTPVNKFYDKSDGQIYDEQIYDENGKPLRQTAEEYHNDLIKKSDILIEWYNGTTNEMLIGFYFDGENDSTGTDGNVLYLNLQGAKRSFDKFGDTVLYRQLIRLLMNLSVEKLLTAGGLQGDAGVSSLRSVFQMAVKENGYKVVLNGDVSSTLFERLDADILAGNITEFIQGIFSPFREKIDPFTLKYLGFAFSVVGGAVIRSVSSDMQFFTEPDPVASTEIMTGALLKFAGATVANEGKVYNYVSDISFEYGLYPPDDMKLDKDFYVPYEYGQYEFVGNLYIPMINSNFDGLIRTDMQQYDNSKNNVFMEFRDIANGELMIGAYYRNERSYIDISGMEYLYGWIDLNELGFPKVYDEHLNLAELLGKMFNGINNGIVSIVDSILSPNTNDKENSLLDYIVEKITPHFKDPDDIFSFNGETILIDMQLIKDFLRETGNGNYTTRQIIDILDSMLPYTMDQIAIMLGVSSAEVMLDNSYFNITWDVDTNKITIELFTNVGIEQGESSTLIFRLDLIPVVIGQRVNIASINFDPFKPLQDIYTYSATMNGNFYFSAAEVVDLSKLLSSTIGEPSGKNTQYILESNAGLTFELTYDQFVKDPPEYKGKPRQGRSAFELNVWLIVNENKPTDSDDYEDNWTKQGLVLSLASDDVSFNNEVYQNLPERESELGYVWVSIECLTEKGVQKIPKLKVREDVFISAMNYYLNGTNVKDDAESLGNTDINLSITSILFALIEDSYVVMEPEQMEITSSNETLQNLFKVEGIIGNIRANAGFRQRVSGLENIKNEYGMYQVGQFENMESANPYTTILHDAIPVYFYDDYFREGEGGYFFSEKYRFTDYDFRVDPATGVIQVYYHKSDVNRGKQVITAVPIDYSSDSFYKKETDSINIADNQDITRVKFRLTDLPFIYLSGDKYCYLGYDGNEAVIDPTYIESSLQSDGTTVFFVRYLGLQDKMYWLGADKYCYFDEKYAVYNNDGTPFCITPRSSRDMFFDYRAKSIEITDACKEQYVPRVFSNNFVSFMGEIRRYVLRMTDTGYSASLGKIEELLNGNLQNGVFYSDEDRNHTVDIFDEKGNLVEDDVPTPIALYVMEPCEPLIDKVDVNMMVNGNISPLDLPCAFDIDWDSVTLKGLMALTEVAIAPGTMGEKTFPVRIIVTNREISRIDVTTVFTENSEKMTQNVPVVDAVNVDPYDYILAKNEFFRSTKNYNPEDYTRDNYLAAFKLKEKEFVNQFFSTIRFTINFDFERSNLKAQNVDETYWAKEFDNIEAKQLFNWNFDAYAGGNNLESMITTDGVVLYLHTYFHGQLIALRVNFHRRKLVLVHFGEDDNFGVDKSGNIDPSSEEVNKGLTPDDNEYIFGKYVANYFDEETYTLPDWSDPTRSDNMIFVFLDENGNYIKKKIDFRYVNGLTDDGNYNDMHYNLTWGDKLITHIGSNGSYHYKKYVEGLYEERTKQIDGEGVKFVTVNGVEYKVAEFTDAETGAKSLYLYDIETGERALFNRPFDIWQGERDENGTPIVEYDPEELVDTDITSTGINWIDLFCIYKKSADGAPIKIRLIEGDSTYSGFMSSVIRITVECPPLEVAKSDTPESDDKDGGKEFKPSLIKIGENTEGYYNIDPLVESTKEIPTSAVIYFKNINDASAGLSRHRFNNIKWYARFDEETDEGLLTNESGVTLLVEKNGRYYFNTEDISLDRPFMTRIVARIGSAVSGYQEIELCINVLSKEPQHVDFYTGTVNNGQKITSIERTDINLTSDGDGAEAFAFYTYYVNTFENFVLPDFVKAYLGSGETVREQYFYVKWRLADSSKNMYFAPNSVQNLIATIGDEDTLDVYLSVVVANYKIYDVLIGEEIGRAYVRVGNNGTLMTVKDLLRYDAATGKSIGLFLQDVADGYIRISTGEKPDKKENEIDLDVGVPAGMIGLYEDPRGENLIRTLYPYDFIKEVYGSLTLEFNGRDENGNVINGGKKVDLVDLSEYRATFVSATGATSTQNIKDAVKIGYSYNANAQRNELNITLCYVDGSTEYYPEIDDNNLVQLKRIGGGNDVYMTVYEIAVCYAYRTLDESLGVVERYNTVFGAVAGDGINTVSVRKNEETGEYEIVKPGTNDVMEGVESVVFTDGREISFRELIWRKKFQEEHRKNNLYVVSTPKNMGIDNLEGIFDINDVAERDGNGYKLILGTGAGSYDMDVRLHFIGGYRMKKENTEGGETPEGTGKLQEIYIRPYSDAGIAQYAESGYILGEEISASIRIETMGGSGAESDAYYGLAHKGADLLTKWYVENVSGALFVGADSEIRKGDFITVIPQSVVYSQRYGELEISSLTKEGFRIRRRLVFTGRSSRITEFNSADNSGLLIRSGKISISDIYNNVPLKNYFANVAMLPKSVSVDFGGGQKPIEVKGVEWALDDDWRSRVNDRMTFRGTQGSEFVMATAQVLGWDEVTETGVVRHDRITLELKIEIDSAEAASLPWDGGKLKLDTTPIKKALEENSAPISVFAVEVDAFNDMGSSAVSAKRFYLPTEVSVRYANGVVHTFDTEKLGVGFAYGNVTVTSIPYNIHGIDLEQLANDHPENSQAFLSVKRDSIILTLDVGLQQSLVFEFRFYDKTAESVTPLISLDDKQIRNTITEALATVSDREINSLLDSVNRTRIRVNMEKIVDQVITMRDDVNKIYPCPTAKQLADNLSRPYAAEAVAEMLTRGWMTLTEKTGAAATDITKNNIKKNGAYDDYSLYNFALVRVKDAAVSVADEYAQVLVRALSVGSLDTAQLHLDNFKNQVQNEVFNSALRDYLKIELLALFENDVMSMGVNRLFYASAYKNAVEAAFDYDRVIREIYRIRELKDCGIYTETMLVEKLKELILNAVADAKDTAHATAKYSEPTLETTAIDNILNIRLGLTTDVNSLFSDKTLSIDAFVMGDLGGNKTELRIALSKFVTELFDWNKFGSYTVDKLAKSDKDVKALIEGLVSDSVNSIERFDSSVSLIRSNIMTSVDTTLQLRLIVERAVKNYVSGIYMESAVAREIKKVQKLNVEYGKDGYYIIDPYYEYRVVPTRLIVNFNETSGGFAYTYTASYANDTVSDSVNYLGNRKNDLYGYVYVFDDAYRAYDGAAKLYLDGLLADADKAVSWETDDLGNRSYVATWQGIKDANATSQEYNTLLIFETLVDFFYDGVTSDNRAELIMNLYKYYLAGNALIKTDGQKLAQKGFDCDKMARDFDKFRLNEVTASLYNENTDERQSVSLIVEVKNKATNTLEFKNSALETVTDEVISIDNPFNESPEDKLPQYVVIDGELLPIVWSGVMATPLGNLDATTHTVRGNIHNVNGQEVTRELYVARWEYAGVYGSEDKKLKNPMNFFFSNSLTYSADDSYEIRFRVYKHGKDEAEYMSLTFYPEDSELLVDVPDDEQMAEIRERSRRVIYWDASARNKVLSEMISGVTGVLEIGNADMGQFRLDALAGSNQNIPKTAFYNYDGIDINSLALVNMGDEENPNWQYGKSGEVTLAVDPYEALPITGMVRLNRSSINYDMDGIEVRLLWNSTYSAALLKLKDFIATMIPTVDSSERDNYAISLLMDAAKRSAEENADLLEKAREYVYRLRPGDNKKPFNELTVSEKESLTREAEQLLMVNERFKLSSTDADRLKGGASGTQTVTVLIRYNGSAYICEKTLLVRVLFADYKPIKYYSAEATTGYREIGAVSSNTAPEELYIGVRTEYWAEAFRKPDGSTQAAGPAYTGSNPYVGIVEETAYRMLENIMKKDNKPDSFVRDGLRLIKVTGIKYQKVSEGVLKSESFTIDGVEYKSDIIALPVSDGGNV